MAGELGHKILDHFRKHSDSSSPSQPQHQQHQHPDNTNAPQSHAWTLSSDVFPLHEGGTYPRLCRLSDGTLLCVVTRVVDGDHILKVTRSTDGGRTFTPHGEITRGKGDIDNGFLLEVPMPNGPVVLAAFRNHTRGPDGKPTHFRITVCRSEDGGRIWRFASQAASQSAAQSGGMGLWEPFMRLCHTGSDPIVQLMYSGELARNDQETFCVESSDGGMTWTGPPRCLQCHANDEPLRDGMVGIAPAHDVADGRQALVMVFETTRRRPHFSLEYVVSYDDGRTWGHRGVVYVPRGDKRNAGSPQIAACRRTGRLAVIFMTDEDEPEKKWPHKAAVKAVFSDGLQAGRLRWSEHPTLIGESPSHWPGVFCFEDGQFTAVYEHRGKPVGRLLHVSG